MGYYFDRAGVLKAAEIVGVDEAALEAARVESISEMSPRNARYIREVSKVNSVLAINLIVFLVRDGVPLGEAMKYLESIRR